MEKLRVSKTVGGMQTVTKSVNMEMMKAIKVRSRCKQSNATYTVWAMNACDPCYMRVHIESNGVKLCFQSMQIYNSFEGL